MQPGDNFKIAASCNNQTLAGVVIDETNLKDSSGNLLPTEQIKATEMLTVWRRLHIEVDSMGAVTGNQVSGTIKSANPNSKNNTTSINVSTNPNLEANRFQNGMINITSVGPFRVLSNGTNSITVQGLVDAKQASGKSFILVDDDDFNNDNGTNKTGDQGENIPSPDLALMVDSLDNGICDNSAANAFGPAYICPVFDLAGNDDFVPFVLNLAANTGVAVRNLYSFDNVSTEGDPGFWTAYLLAAYQPVLNEDGDPDSELAVKVTLGISDLVQGGVVFLETIREISSGPNCTIAATAVHELGHLMGAVHEDGGIMGGGCATSPSFTDPSLDKIRRRPNP
jgi:hypothetical protein